MFIVVNFIILGSLFLAAGAKKKKDINKKNLPKHNLDKTAHALSLEIMPSTLFMKNEWFVSSERALFNVMEY